eukprot:Skav200029  [mRNA]  locus=scaffold225:185947:189255:- [translate_table: standard]
MQEQIGETISEWRQALRECKTHSAPGLDGFSIAELRMLPDTLLVEILNIISSQTSFPSETMLAKTVPFPKKGQFTPPSSRPITILATLYRVWAKTCCAKVSQHFAQIMPPQITGMLPTKGAFEASYTMQSTLEQARRTKRHIAGLTLDLRKCFNLINRNKIIKLMQVFGVAPKALNLWAQSLTSLQRVWVLDAFVSEPTKSSSGCPEGDPWSVMAMLVIAGSWVFLLTGTNPLLDAAAYADNWSWWLPEEGDHADPVSRTIQFTTWMGLEIDWSKTWVWGTSKTATQAIRNVLQRLVPHTAVTYRWYADDLGCPLTYQGNSKLGVILDRLDTAKQRLKVLKCSAWSLAIKIHMLVTSIFPVALYGSEVAAIGTTHLDQLRSQAASAIIGDTCKSMNSAVCLLFASMQDLDPHLLVIIKALKAAKMYLHRVDDATKQIFLDIAATPDQRLGISQGPASALREYLGRIGWSISRTGNIQVTSYCTCNLLTSPFPRLLRYLRWAWEEQVLMMHTSRPKLYNMPPVDKTLTVQILDTYTPAKKTLLLREIAGAFQTTHQQSRWNSDVTETCQWCGAEQDDRAHRLLTCPAFSQVREPFQELVQHYIEHGSGISEMPILYKHPHYEYFDAVHANMSMPTLSDDVIQRISNRDSSPNFFTDGSLKFPASRTTRYAAFSVVVDLCTDDHQRIEQAELYLVTKAWPTTLQKLQVARLAGEQCIHRAETEAVLKVLESFNQATVFTDSASTVAKVETCQVLGPTHSFHAHADCDLMLRFQRCLRPDHVVRKIKAHQDPCQVTDPLQRYWVLGNAYADFLADYAAEHLLPDLVQEWNDRHHHTQSELRRYDQLCNMILQLQFAREQSQMDDTPEVVPSDRHNTALLLRTVSAPWGPRENWNENWLQYSVWGVHAMYTTQRWLQALHWETDLEPDFDTAADIGISWTEVAISMALQRGMWLPVKRVTADGTTVILQPTNLAETDTLNIDLAEQTASAHALVTHYKALVPDAVVPTMCKFGKCSALYVQGYFQWSTGMRPRPAFPHQQQVIDILRPYLLTHHAKLGTLPVIPTDEGFEPWTEDRENLAPWSQRWMKLQSILHQVRRCRKNLAER